MQNKKRVLITAGGTGGHLFPAQGLAQDITKHVTTSEILFVAGGLATNRYFERERFPFKEIACSPLLSKNPVKALRGMKNLFKGTCQCVAIMKEFQPDVVVGFGSYYTVPILLAARWLKIPIILHEANSIPGRANQWLAALADTVALHFPSTAAYFKGKSRVVGLPLREGYQKEAISKETALAFYQLSQERRTLLIFGGSQGAKGINRAVQHCLPHVQKLNVQIIHLTGDQKMSETLSSLYAESNIPAVVKPFEKEMRMAWRCADAFIGRSGAATVAESIEFEVPGILIPYPHATDNHQEKNADFLVDTVKSSWKLLESELEEKSLGEMLERFFKDGKIEEFRQAIVRHKQRPNQTTLFDLLIEVLEKG